jgi:hypothetical protein
VPNEAAERIKIKQRNEQMREEIAQIKAFIRSSRALPSKVSFQISVQLQKIKEKHSNSNSNNGATNPALETCRLQPV